MDAGIAGLIGALSGAAIGAAGAWTAARITSRGTRYQADQQRQSAHQQWLRQIRREAYTNFLTAADTLLGQLMTADLAPSRSARAAAINAMSMEELDKALNTLRLEAPPDITRAAKEVHDAALDAFIEAQNMSTWSPNATVSHWGVGMLLGMLREKCRETLQEERA